MEYTPGELADKTSIASLRFKNHDTDENFQAYSRYLTAFREMMTPTIFDLYLQLLDVNGCIWELEAAIRNGELEDMEEIGRRALKIRDFNRKRIEVVNKINTLFNIPAERKINHASE